MQSLVEHVLTAANIQPKSRFDGEKAITISETVSETMKQPDAAGRKVKEMNRLNDPGVYTVVYKLTNPPGKKAVGSRGVVKRHADGAFKAYIVPQARHVVPGVNCSGVFSSIRRLQCTQMVLAIAAKKNCEVLQLVVRTAFRNADIERETYVAKAKHFEIAGGALRVMKLLKRMNGVQDACMNWSNIVDCEGRVRPAQVIHNFTA